MDRKCRADLTPSAQVNFVNNMMDVELHVVGLAELGIPDISQDKLSKLAKRACAYAQASGLATRRYEISLVMASDEKIKDLNAQYRKKNAPTDVLSFGFFDVPNDPQAREGEIVISPTHVKKQAVEYGHSEEFELLFLFVHGILHLFGYTDDVDETREEMERMGHEIIGTFATH